MTPLRRAIADEIVGRVSAMEEEHVAEQARCEPEWLRYLDPEHQARLQKKIRAGWVWANFNPTNHLLMQIITDLRQAKFSE